MRTHTAYTSIPEGLTPWERNTYVRGYSKACVAYVRKHGAPALSGPVPMRGPERAALGVELAEMARAHEAERHPTAHKAGVAAVNKLRKRDGLPTITATGRKPREMRVCHECGSKVPVTALRAVS